MPTPETPKAVAKNVDGIAPSIPPAPAPVAVKKDAPKADAKTPLDPKVLKNKVGQMKRLLLVALASVYILFLFWALFLVAILPSAEDGARALIPVGTLTSLLFGAFLVVLGFFLFTRLARQDVSVKARQMGLIKIIAMVLPGLALSLFVPYAITREPALFLQITEPTSPTDFVAPLAVTFSAEKAAETLTKLNLKPIKYAWDTNGDGQIDQETIEPKVTAIFDRAGVYSVGTSVTLEGNQKRAIRTRLTIPTGVFSTSPLKPVVERPVKFSVTHLLPDPKLLTEVTWTFGDAGKEEISKLPDIVHTYFTADSFDVTAVVKLSNNTQQTYTRTIIVTDPPPLPFAATLSTVPKTLVGPAPMGPTFTISTSEELKDVQWDYGDGKSESGKDLKSVSHLFEQTGIFPVTVRLRNVDGEVAELSTLVRVTETLNLSDLRFDGTPEVANNIIRGEAPLTVDLTPKTLTPLVRFTWEDDDGEIEATTPGSSRLSRVYRDEGQYPLVLIAQDAEGKAVRLNLTVQVDPPSPDPQIVISPEGGPAPLVVKFDASRTFVPPGQQIAGFEWQFGDEVSGQKPLLGAAFTEHTYKNAGEYTIQLRVVMSDGKDYRTTRKIVVRLPTLTACFTASRTTVQVGQGVDFDPSCTLGAPTSLLWDIRSESNPALSLAQSENQNYSYVFDTPGTYQVSLTLEDSFDNKDTKTVTITVVP